MIVFVVLAHYGEDVLQDQINNIYKFVPNSRVVIYNGGKNSDFGLNCGVKICPYSRPVQSKYKLGRVLFDTMVWLEEENYEYDYIVYLDSDILFINEGYEATLNKLMDGYDAILTNMALITEDNPCHDWKPANAMWNDWHKWQPFFKTDYFVGCLNAVQTYRKSLVQKIINSVDHSYLYRLLDDDDLSVPALEEILVPTIASSCGGNVRSYPTELTKYIILGPPLSLEDVQIAKQDSNIYFIHPVERDMNNKARLWIRDKA